MNRTSLTSGVTLAAGAVLVLGVSGCGARSPSEGSTAGGESGGTGVSARYESVQEGGDAGGAPQRLSVIAQGQRFRMALSEPATPDEVYQTVVWDGADLLLLEGEDASREQDPPADQRPTPFLLQVGDAGFEQLCPGGVRGGSERVAGRRPRPADRGWRQPTASTIAIASQSAFMNSWTACLNVGDLGPPRRASARCRPAGSP